ncbi:MAG: L-dopachrome tautomerase-related protein [Verrucomicrobiales bacterium]
MTDPAGGATAALIVVDLRSNLARRVLQGHYSVVPVPDSPIMADGKPVQARRADGAAVMPQTGVVPVACDRKGEWVYFGPANGRTVYRIRAEHLRDTGLTPIELASRVDGYGEKPACVSMTIDNKGNLYFGDLAQNAISVLDAKEQKLRVYFSDPLISWPGGLCFGPDDKLYFFASQLHRSPFLNRGKNEVQPPIQLLRLKAIAGGQVGR